MKNEKINEKQTGYTRLKKHAVFFFIFFFLFSLFSFLSCDDPVFYEISTQVEILPPIISGSPTSFAQIEWSAGTHYVYVASGSRLFYFDISKKNEDPSKAWKQFNPGHGRIISLVSTESPNKKLYALTTNGVYAFKDHLPGQHPVPDDPISAPSYWYLTMFSANNEVFVGARDSSQKYHVLRVDSGNLIGVSFDTSVFSDNKPLLRGVAYNGTDYFYCFKDQDEEKTGGIFFGTDSRADIIEVGYKYSFLGIVNIDTDIYAIDNEGNLYKVTASEITSSVSMRNKANGLLYVWDVPDSTDRLLIAGRKDTSLYNTTSGFTYGYMEAVINPDGTGGLSDFRDPGRHSIRTVDNNERFKTTLGKYSVKFIHQVKNENIAFASTEQQGVWSLRDRDGKGSPYWNTEN